MNYKEYFEAQDYLWKLKGVNTDLMSNEHQNKIFIISLLIGVVTSGVFQMISGPFWFYFGIFKSMVVSYIFSTFFQIMSFMGIAWLFLMIIALIKRAWFLHSIKKLERDIEKMRPVRWMPELDEDDFEIDDEFESDIDLSWIDQIPSETEMKFESSLVKPVKADFKFTVIQGGKS